MGALILELADRFAEGTLKFAHLGRHQLREPKQNRSGDPAPRKVFDNFPQVGRARIAFGWTHDQITLSIYVEISCAPVFNSVSLYGLFDGSCQLAVSWSALRCTHNAAWLLSAKRILGVVTLIGKFNRKSEARLSLFYREICQSVTCASPVREFCPVLKMSRGYKTPKSYHEHVDSEIILRKTVDRSNSPSIMHVF